MTNPFYTASGNPGTRAPGASQAIRTEFEAIQDAFDMFPAVLTPNKALVVNAGGTAVELTVGSLALAGNFTTLGAYALTLTATGATNVTLPTTGTLSTLAGAETLTNKTISGSANTLSNIGNSSLTNSSITINGSAVSLGGSVTVTAVASSIVVGTTAITSGTTTRVLYNNGGTLGEYAVSGSGSVAMTTSPTLTTPTINGALTYGGVTLSAAVTGTGSMVLSASPTITGILTTNSLSSAAANNLAINAPTGNLLIFTNNSTPIASLGSTSLFPNTNNATTLGGSSTRWSTVYGVGGDFLSADTAVSGRFGGATSKLRMWGYYNAAATVDAATADELGYYPLRLIGSSIYLNANGGSDVLSLSSTQATLAVALNYGGVTLSNSVTGTGSMVLGTSPTLTTPTLGVASATSVNFGGGAFTATAINSVSPTSPNRTLTISFGGTTYYVAAKTTND